MRVLYINEVIFAPLTKRDHQLNVQRLENALKAKYPDLSLMLVYYDEERYGRPTIEISSIIISNRGRGIGSAVMQDIVKYADDEGYQLILNASDSYGGDVDNLYKFYERFGFVKNMGDNANLNFKHNMIRKNK